MPNSLRSLNELCELPVNALITTDEAASYLHMSREALAIRRSRGDLPDYCKHGRLIRYRKSALDEFMSDPDSMEQSKATANG